MSCPECGAPPFCLASFKAQRATQWEPGHVGGWTCQQCGHEEFEDPADERARAEDAAYQDYKYREESRHESNHL